jgi:hypothetical protein
VLGSFRGLGRTDEKRVPPEYSALLFILNRDNPAPLLQDGISRAGPSGFIFFAAGLNDLDLPSTPPDFQEPVPIMVEGGNLIVLEPADDLYRDQVLSGKLLKTIRDVLTPDSPSKFPAR